MSSLFSLPDDVVLNCLVRVPERCYGNISCVSKRLRSLVLSPELHRLRSLLYKDSIYLYCFNKERVSFQWFTLCRSEETTTDQYQLVPLALPSCKMISSSSTVVVGSKIYFIGGYFTPLSVIRILDTRSGKLTRGPSMNVACTHETAAVGVVDRNIYVIRRCFGEDENQVVEVFDPDHSQTWEFASEEIVQSLEKKVHAMDFGVDRIGGFYKLREGRLRKTMERKGDRPICVCVVESVLFAYFRTGGLMWFDTKLNAWTRLVTSDEVLTLEGEFCNVVMSKYDGKLAVFWPGYEIIGYMKE
ncbi:hypothetical protein CARUB_v10024653mg, partial [Capsella rubella]